MAYPIAIDKYTEKTKELITELIEKHFYLPRTDQFCYYGWLMSGIGALSDIPDGMNKIAKECFHKYLTKDTYNIFNIYHYNIVFTLRNYYEFHPTKSSKNIIKYIHAFMDVQSEYIDVLSEIRNAMWNDESLEIYNPYGRYCSYCVGIRDIFNSVTKSHNFVIPYECYDCNYSDTRIECEYCKDDFKGYLTSVKTTLTKYESLIE